LEDGIKGLRVAYSPNLGGAAPRPEVLSLVTQSVNIFRDSGAGVAEVGAIIEPLQPNFEAYWLAGFADRLRQIAPEKRDLLDPRFRALAEEGLAVGLEAYYAAVVARARLSAQFETFLQDYDLLVTPTMPTTAPPVTTLYHSESFDRWRDAVPYTLPFNLTGQPAASIPCGVSAEGLPAGLQIIGRRGADALVLRASRAFERATEWQVPHPALAASLQRLGA
jgi:aspartyl-tRNA(Asn)/glutamyl-tRNA(Gln) amidotransferase subunit A